MILASHFSTQLELRALLAFVLIAGPVVAAWFLVRGTRSAVRCGLAAMLVVPVGAGAFQVAEVSAAHHNHLCHAHGSDLCDGGGAHDEDGHIHGRGGWAAEKDSDR